MDQVPDSPLSDRQVPPTALLTADRNRPNSGDKPGVLRRAAQLPEYFPPPSTSATHLPSHASLTLRIDQVPEAKTLSDWSNKFQAP
jgi:hypothetical protein